MLRSLVCAPRCLVCVSRVGRTVCALSGGMEVDGAPEVAPAEAAPSQTLYVHNLAERPRKDGAFCSSPSTTLTLDLLSGFR